MSNLHLTHPLESDLPSLSTIIPRAFHPTNDFFRSTFPDTPLLRQWWTDLFLHEIRNPRVNPLCIVDTSHPPSADGSRHVVAVLPLRHADAADTGNGIFDSLPPTADHDKEKYAAMLNPPDNSFDRWIQEEDRLQIEVFGVDHAYQGQGLGGRLMDEVVRVAEERGMDVFVGSNLMARRFYEGRGFVVLEKAVVSKEGEEEYGECLLRYRCQRRRGQDDAKA